MSSFYKYQTSPRPSSENAGILSWRTQRGNLPSHDLETTRATKKNGVGWRLAPPIVIPDSIGKPGRATGDGFQTAEGAEGAAHPRAATKGNVSADFADLRRFVPSESVKSAQSADDLILFLLPTYSLSSQKACQDFSSPASYRNSSLLVA